MRTLLIYMMLFLPVLAYAQTWTGNVSNSWHEPGNWDGNSVPASNAIVNIRPVGSNPYPVVTQDVTVERINLSEWWSGGDLTVSNNATLTVNDRFDINNNGHLFLDGGHLVFSGNGTDQRRINMGNTNSLIQITEGGSLVSANAWLHMNGELLVDEGYLNLGNGLKIQDNKLFYVSVGQIVIDGELDAAGDFYMEAGELEVTGNTDIKSHFIVEEGHVSFYGRTNINGILEGHSGNFIFDGDPTNNQHKATIRSGGKVYMSPSTELTHPPDCPENTPDAPPLSGGTIDFFIESSVENNGRLWGGDAVITYHKPTNSQGDAITEIHNGIIVYKDDATFSNTASINITCKGSVMVEGDGTFQQNGMMDVGQGNLTVSGNAVFQNTGVLYGGDGNITFEDNVLIAGNGGAIFAENSTINFNGGTFNHSGTFDPGTSTFIFGADGNQEIVGSNNLITFYNLVVEEGADVQSSQNVLVLNDMEVEEDGFFDVDDGLTINVIGDVTGHPNVDTNRPYIISLFILNDTSINVVFNEALDQATAENPSNYRIDDQIIGGSQIGTIVSAELSGANNNEVVLELSLSTASGIIEQGENYILVVNNVENLDGRTVSPNHRKRFGYPNFLAFELRYYPGGLDKTNLQLWLDAGDPDFMFTDFSGKQKAGDGDPVAFWADKSGNNRNALQSDESLMPVLTGDLAIGGRPSLIFDNAEYLVFDGSFVENSDYSIAALVARSSSKSFNVYLGGNNRGANQNLHIFWSSSTRLNHHHWGNDYAADVPPFDGSLAGEIHVMDYKQATSPHRHLYRNGELLNTLPDHRPMLSWQGASIGRYSDPNSSSHNSRFEGYVSEMIMHNKRLSESERIILENYKAARWGQELTATSKKFDAPEGFTHQLAGIGRHASTDLVEETVYTSGGMGFSNSNPGFLSHDGNYLMAAHNNEVGVDSTPYFTSNHILMKWSRAWYVEKTLPGSDGTLDLYFDLADYGLPAPASNAEYIIIHHPSDPGFPAASTTALSASSFVAGTKVSFSLSSEDLANGYYTIGEYIAPAIADPGQTTITAVPTVIEADGVSEAVITVQAKYFTGDPLVSGGDLVDLLSTAGTLSGVTDNGDGTYTAILTSSTNEATVEITGTINGELIDDGASVIFKTGAADAGETTISADPVFIVADGVSTSLITVQSRDKQGNALSEGGDQVTLTTTAGSLTAITDNGNGTYTAQLTSETTAQMAIISGTINAAPIQEQATVTFTPGAPDPGQTTLFAFPQKITANGQSKSTIIVQAIDEFENSLTSGGDLVTISTTAGTLSSVTDNGDGSYAAFLTSSETVETAFITATINGSDLNEAATVDFVDYIVLNYYPGGLDNSNLQLWFDAKDPSVLFADAEGNVEAVAGDRIGQWRDKSIFGRHATQETYALRPLLDGTNGFGVRPSLFFDDAEFLLFDGTFAANTNYTVNAVVTRTSDKEYNVYLGGTETGANNNLHLFWSNNRLHYHHFLNDLNAAIPSYDGNQQGEWHMFRFSGEEEEPARRIYKDGVLLGSITSTNALNDWQGASIGRYTPRGGDFFEGRMAELIFYGYPINNTERVIIGNYTSARWGYPLDEEITFYVPPGGFDQQLVGIGRFSASDLVSETIFTSGGLGFRTTLSGFLAGINNYMMAAHNGETGIANQLLYLDDEYIERWQRSWYIQKTAPNGDGLIQLYFNTFDYNETYPARRDDFFLLYHPSDPEFPEASAVIIDADAIVEGVEIRFTVQSSQLNNGYYTLGRLSKGVTYYSRITGPWNDTDTWSLISHAGSAAGQLPGEDDQAIIAANHVVTLVENVTNETGTILVGNTGTLVTNQHVIAGGGRFVLEPGGTLHIGSADGISASGNTGNIQTSIRNFSTQANYVYDGLLPQQTGDGLPAKVMDLRIDNPLGVDAVASLTVNGQLQLDNGLFSMPPGSSLVANDVEQTNGNLRMQLTIDGGKGWRMITSPVQTSWADLLDGLVSQGFPGSSFPEKQPNLLWFDEEEVGTTNMAWRAPENINDPITGGTGHFHYVFNGAEMLENGDSSGVFYDDVLPVTMDATGLEHAAGTGFFDFHITYTPRTELNITDTIDIPEMNAGWNLLGNPSTASLNWNNEPGWVKTNIDESIYIWDPEANNGEGEFLFWNGNAGTLNDGLIAPFQSFWIRAHDENPALLMNGDAKTTGGTFVGNSFSGKSQPYFVPTSLTLKLEAEGMETYAMLSFTENGEIGEDPGDAYRLEPLGTNWLKLYTTTSKHHVPMVLNNLPAFFEDPLIIPLYYEGERQGKPVGGEHRLSWTMPENWPLHWEIVLMDHANKKVIPMDKETNTILFFTNQAYNSAPASASASGMPELPGSIVSKPSEHIARAKTRLIPGKNNPDDGSVSPKTSSLDVPPAFSIVIYPGDVPEEIEYIPQTPELIMVYPNPVRNVANIRFSLPESAKVEFLTYDIHGRLMQHLSPQSYVPGVHNIPWSSDNLKPGVYVVEMRSGDHRDTQRVVVQ